jgi:hypothetical protein
MLTKETNFDDLKEAQIAPSALDDLFKERDSVKSDNYSKGEDEPLKKEASDPKKQKEQKTDIEKPELEKLKKALNDSQKWGHTNNRRLKNVEKIIKSLKEREVLNDDEFSELSNLLTSDVGDEIPESVKPVKNPLDNLTQIANKKLDDLREICEEDELFDKKIASFDHYVGSCSKEEIEDLVDDLEKLKDTPLKLAKKMLSIGEAFYNDIGKDIDNAGGVKGLLSTKNAELEKMQKKIDKLEKKLAEYDDYDKPTYKVDEISDVKEHEGLTDSKPNDTLSQLFNERDRIKG